jgi:PilZ domain
MSNNKRRTSRRTVNAPAWMEIGSDARLRRCRLVDISENGARLIVENIENTPDSFNLLLSRFGRPNYRCSVIWKRDNEVGVEFLASPSNEARQSVGPTSTLK